MDMVSTFVIMLCSFGLKKGDCNQLFTYRVFYFNNMNPRIEMKDINIYNKKVILRVVKSILFETHVF